MTEQTRTKGLNSSALCYALFAAFILYFYRYLLTSNTIPAEDLPTHIELIKQLKVQLLHGNLLFYDKTSFGGFPAFQFYGFLAHLIVALISFPLQIVSENSETLAAHLLILISFATLPITISYSAIKILGKEDLTPTFKNILTLFSVVFSLWFLFHDEQFFGLGAGSIIYVGLLPQVLGWHFLFLLCASLFEKTTTTKKVDFRLSLLLALTLMTHTLTAAYCFALCLFSALFYAKRRLRIVLSLLSAICLSAWWVFPFLQFSSSYTLPDPYPNSGDLFQFLLRYPISEIFSQVKSAGIIQTFANLNFSYLLILSCLIYLALNIVDKSQYLFPVLILFLLDAILSSQYLASSISIAFHYYRFHSYAVICLLVFLTLIPCLLLQQIQNTALTKHKTVLFLLCLFAILSIATTLSNPPMEHKAVLAVQNKPDRDKDDLLSYLGGASPTAGRVFIEYLNDYSKFPYLSSHRIEAELFNRTNREMLNGLLVESSTAYRIFAPLVAKLNASVFSPYLIFAESSNLDDSDLITQIKGFGVTHIIAGTQNFISKLAPFSLETKTFGKYSLIKIAEEKKPEIEAVFKPIIGYYDPTKAIPFYLIEFYFASKKELINNFELVEIKDTDSLLPLSAMIVISNDADLKNNFQLKTSFCPKVFAV
jgi:hypothetical protein